MLIKGRVVDVDSGTGIEGVLISNGEKVVGTGHEGCCKLGVDLGVRRFIFVAVPEGYRPPGEFLYLGYFMEQCPTGGIRADGYTYLL